MNEKMSLVGLCGGASAMQVFVNIECLDSHCRRLSSHNEASTALERDARVC